MKNPFKLYEKDGQQILAEYVCNDDEMKIRFAAGFDQFTADLSVGYEASDALDKGWAVVDESHAIGILENLQQMFQD